MAYPGSPNAAGQQAAAMGGALGQGQDRPATELEGFIGELRGKLQSILHNSESVFWRVMPPTPQTAETSKIAPVPTTYADKMRELLGLAEQIHSLTAELNGRI